MSNCSRRRSQIATTPRPSIGDMHCRAVRSRRRTTIGADVANRSGATSMNVSRKTLLSQCSCTRISLLSAVRISTTAGSSSNSTSTAAARSSAAARLAATQTAIGSPTCRTLPSASTGWTEALKPGKAEIATIGCTPLRSAAVNTVSSAPGGLRTPRMRACATGLRTNARSRMLGRRMSAMNSPLPRK